MEQVTQLLLCGSYNLPSRVDDSCQAMPIPGYNVESENTLNKTAIHRLKDVAADSKTL